MMSLAKLLGRKDWRPEVRGKAMPGLLAVAVGLVAGALVAAVTPLYAAAGLAGLALGWAVLRSTQAGFLVLIGVIFLLPFGVIPIPIGGVKLTLLDAALSGLLIVWVARLLARPQERLIITPLGGLVLVFIGLAATSLVAGLSYGITPEAFRLFLKMINSLLLFFTVLNCLRTPRQLQQVVMAMVAGGGLAAFMALVLYLLPAETTVGLLSRLRPLGYPSGPEVLRFIADTKALRATGSAIDPNVLGAGLMVASALAAGQCMAPGAGRRRLLAALALMVPALLLTFSRSSWAGLVAALIFLGTMKYRRLWVLFGALALALYFLPGEERFVAHLETGLRAQDRATAMRLGEYKDALSFISRHPWLGAGFGAAPSVDLYVGVSSLYLLMAEYMGLVGLGFFILMMGLFYHRTLGSLRNALGDTQLQGLALSATAAVTAALVAGLFDHHFFNLRFPHALALFWLCVGLAEAAVRLGKGNK